MAAEYHIISRNLSKTKIIAMKKINLEYIVKFFVER